MTKDGEGSPIDKIAIVGLGIMGGSLAKALKVKQEVSLVGIDQEYDTIFKAFEEGVITEGYTDFDIVKWNTLDYIFLCTPVEKTVELMKKIDGNVKESVIVTDLTSTKEQVMEVAKELQYDFIGGHPMVGSEKMGYQNSKYHLYENAYYVITGLEKTPKEKIDRLHDLISGIGAIPIKVEVVKHDLVTAIISHVPHLVAASLVHMVSIYEDGENMMLKLAAGGFKDITRIASANPELWKQITLSNKEKISKILEKLITNLQELHKNIIEEKDDYIYNYFSDAKKIRDLIQENTMVDQSNKYEVIVDIEDKPGKIAKISTLLYESSINIKNIGIMNNREFENGVLKIVLETKMDQFRATELLKAEGYLIFE